MRNRYFPRSAAGILLQTLEYELRAASTAESTSVASASATLASNFSVAGLIVEKYFPDLGGTNFPLMKRL